jgi:hypothetical protein
MITSWPTRYWAAGRPKRARTSVTDLGQGKDRAGRDRDQPAAAGQVTGATVTGALATGALATGALATGAAPGPVKEQQDGKHGDRGARVVRVLEEHPGAAGEAQCQHDPDGDASAVVAGRAPLAAPGDQRGQEHRVGERAADVHHIR